MFPIVLTSRSQKQLSVKTSFLSSASFFISHISHVHSTIYFSFVAFFYFLLTLFLLYLFTYLTLPFPSCLSIHLSLRISFPSFSWPLRAFASKIFLLFVLIVSDMFHSTEATFKTWSKMDLINIERDEKPYKKQEFILKFNLFCWHTSLKRLIFILYPYIRTYTHIYI